MRKVKAEGVLKYLGMMFQIKPPKLIFEFKKPVSTPIHSLFCRKFIAEWYDDKDFLIQRILIKPFRMNIKCDQKFSKLIEIPYYLYKQN